MPALSFNGASSSLIFGTPSVALRNVPAGGHTIAVVTMRTVWDAGFDAVYNLSGLTTTGFDPRASAEWQSTSIFTVQDSGNNRNWTHGMGNLINVPVLIVVSKASGAVANNVSVLRLDTGVWTHGATAVGANSTALPTTGGLHFGQQSGADFLSGKMGVFAAWQGIAMDQTQRMACGTNKKTSDMANHSAGAPVSLIEFTSAAPSDLLGGVGSIFTNANVTLDSAETMGGWNFDGLGAVGVTQFTTTITDDELVAAGAVEGNNLLKVFVRDAAGNWST